jgi:hypothetical protein
MAEGKSLQPQSSLRKGAKNTEKTTWRSTLHR